MSRRELDKLVAQLPLLSEREDLELTARARRTQRRTQLVESGVIQVILPRDAEWVIRDAFPIETAALDAMRRFEYAHSGLGLYDCNTLMLMGLRGIGKTVATAWLLATPERTHNGRPLAGPRLYITAERLRLAHRARTQEFERACAARILIVDELGTEGDEREEALSAPLASPSSQRSLLELVTRRAGDSMALTVLTANVAKEILVRRYDARTIEKISQRARWVVVDGPNLRVPLELREDYQRAVEAAQGKKP